MAVKLNSDTTSSKGEPVGDVSRGVPVAVRRLDARRPGGPVAVSDSAAARGAAIGAACGFVGLTVVIFIVGTLGGIGPAGALGLGLFVGAFGGVGFGFMMGGMLALTKHTPAPCGPADGGTMPPV